MSVLEHEVVRINGNLRVTAWAHTGDIVCLETVFLPAAAAYGSTALHMSAAEALRVGAALVKVALAALAHQNAQALTKGAAA